jgi:hypothetical protein
MHHSSRGWYFDRASKLFMQVGAILEVRLIGCCVG